MTCPYCPVRDRKTIIFEDQLVLFLRDERYHGALKYSGVIIPIQHRDTVFDLTPAEVTATFALLTRAGR
jgi:hypothetical protein